MERLTLLLFVAALLGCVILQTSVLYALLFGLFVFSLYALRSGFTPRRLAAMLLSGVWSVRNMLLVFVLIGMLTGVWRAAGTIPVIICYASRLIHPSVFLLLVFLLNCAVSALTGTSFGTAATMGVICMTMAESLGIRADFTGGAILSGIFFGDRCSPVSTSALLVCTLTDTDIYGNIRRMCRSALVPFLAACAIYLGMGFLAAGSGASLEVQALFSAQFRLHWAALLPAAAILILSACRVNVKITMLVSILLAVILCAALQHRSLADVLRLMVVGFRAEDADTAAMMDGGGIVSMLSVLATVSLSSAYAGIFAGTGLLNGMRRGVTWLSRQITPFGGILCTAMVTAAISCSQSLCLMLTNQLCGGLEPDKGTFAAELEDSSIVLPALIPWSVACSVPLATVDAPGHSMLFACFLYLLPLWGLVFYRKKRTCKL